MVRTILVVLGRQREGCTSRVMRPVRPMRWVVGLGRIRQIEVDHVSDLSNIDAAGGDIRGDHDADPAAAEVVWPWRRFWDRLPAGRWQTDRL